MKVIHEKHVLKYLGYPKKKQENYEHETSGLVNLLSSTASGGKIIKLEIDDYSGHGNLITTGNLGKIIKESVDVAFGYLHANHKAHQIDLSFFDLQDLHFHFADNASLKDGPSAGVGITVGLYSLAKDIIIPHHIGFTGEITLKGKVLKVGGIANKLSACLYEQIDKVYLPVENKEDVESLNHMIKNKIEIIYVSDVKEILDDLSKHGDQQ